MASQHILRDCMASEYKPQAACLIRPRTIAQQCITHYDAVQSIVYKKPIMVQFLYGTEEDQLVETSLPLL